MAKTLDELMKAYAGLMVGKQVYPAEPSNDGCNVSAHVEALVKGSTPEATQRLQPELDAFVLKL